MTGANVVRLPSARMRRQRQPSAVLEAWRRPLADVGSAEFAAVAVELEGISLFREPWWMQARDGDVGCAISLALDHAFVPNRITCIRRAQVVLTLLWAHASRGDEASRLTLEMLRPRLSAR